MNSNKFVDSDITAKGEKRAWVDPDKLKTLWFNTGTLCNLQCESCYIESSPKNDRLVYITVDDVESYLDEIRDQNHETSEIAFTGGEPFLNPHMVAILDLTLSRGFEVLVLTNAMKPMMKRKEALLELNEKYPGKLTMRVSLDHYTEKLHAAERGSKAWDPAMVGLQWLSECNFKVNVAGRTFSNETDAELRQGYGELFASLGVKVDANDSNDLVLFPEMTESKEVPEITTACWDILMVDPNSMMCASSRMVVKRKGAEKASVAACTLLPYDEEFDLGDDLKSSWRKVSLNHSYCAQFCVLGGGSCSG